MYIIHLYYHLIRKTERYYCRWNSDDDYPVWCKEEQKAYKFSSKIHARLFRKKLAKHHWNENTLFIEKI